MRFPRKMSFLNCGTIEALAAKRKPSRKHSHQIGPCGFSKVDFCKRVFSRDALSAEDEFLELWDDRGACRKEEAESQTFSSDRTLRLFKGRFLQAGIFARCAFRGR